MHSREIKLDLAAFGFSEFFVYLDKKRKRFRASFKWSDSKNNAEHALGKTIQIAYALRKCPEICRF